MNFPFIGLLYIWLTIRGKTCREHIVGKSQLGHVVFGSLCVGLSVLWTDLASDLESLFFLD